MTTTLSLLAALSASALATTEAPPPPAAEASPAEEASADAPPAAAAGDVLAAIDAAAADIGSLRYGAVRRTERNDTVVEERWRFATEGEKFRVDYNGDTQRIVICNGYVLIDYVPALGKAMHYELTEMDGAEASRALSAVISKVAIPGMRAGADPSWDWRWGEATTVGDDAGWTIVGTDAGGGELTYVVSGDGERLLSSQIRSEGAFVVQVTARDHVELAEGVWLPQTVAMQTPAEGGSGDVTIQVSGAAAGQDLPDSLFDIRLDPSIEIEVVR